MSPRVTAGLRVLRFGAAGIRLREVAHLAGGTPRNFAQSVLAAPGKALYWHNLDYGFEIAIPVNTSAFACTRKASGPVAGMGFVLSQSGIETDLRRHPFCRGMDERHVATLTHCSRYWSLQAGEFLWRQGERADTCFLVLAGEVSVELGVPNEDANRLELLKAGDVLGWSWLLEGGRWHFDSRALTTVHGIALDTSKMRILCAEDFQFGYAVLSRCTPLIADRLERTRKLALELLRTAHA